MKQLSRWARQNPGQARISIAVLQVLLMLLAVYTGSSLQQLDCVFPPWFAYTALGLYGASILAYPARNAVKNIHKNSCYTIRKSCDALLAGASFVLVCFTVNQPAITQSIFYYPVTSAAASVETPGKPVAVDILASLSHRDKHALTRKEKRILKKEFGKQLVVYTKAKLMHDDEAGLKALFIILSIIGAIGLTYLLAALSCSIACGGATGAAIILACAGMIGIITLLIVVIKTIKKHHSPATA